MDELLLAKGVLDCLLDRIRCGSESNTLQMIRGGSTHMELAQAMGINIEAVRNGMRTVDTGNLGQEARKSSDPGDCEAERSNVCKIQPSPGNGLSNQHSRGVKARSYQATCPSHVNQPQFTGHISQLLSHR